MAYTKDDIILRDQCGQVTGESDDHMRETACGYTSKSEFYAAMHEVEREFIREKFSEDDILKYIKITGDKRKGEWKVNAFQCPRSEVKDGWQVARNDGTSPKVRVYVVPPDHQSMKSALGKAIDYNADARVTGGSMVDIMTYPKHKMEKLGVERATLTAWDKAKRGFAEIYQAWPQLNDSERGALNKEFGKFMTGDEHE